MSTKEMGVVLQVPAKEKKDFRAVLDELYSEGKIQLDLKGKIKPLSEDIFVGKFMGTQRGFGFVRVEGDDEDIFIPAHKTRGAIDGDTVHVVIDDKAHGKRREGEVISIVERGTDILVGTYSKSKSFGFVVRHIRYAYAFRIKHRKRFFSMQYTVLFSESYHPFDKFKYILL